MSGVFDVLGHMADDPYLGTFGVVGAKRSTAKVAYAQHPWLETLVVPAGLYAAEDREAFLAPLVARYGETLTLSCCAEVAP